MHILFKDIIFEGCQALSIEKMWQEAFHTSAAGSRPCLWLFSFPVTMSVTKLAREEQFGNLLLQAIQIMNETPCGLLYIHAEKLQAVRGPPQSQSVVSVIPVFRKKKV